MGRVLHIINRIWDKVLIACGALGTLLPSSPLYMPFPARDSGVFLYIGWRILNGELPYRDIWDHKPPVVYYIDALGLSMTPHSRWGVWLIEWVALFVAAYLGFKLISAAFGRLAAILSSFLWLLTLVFLITGGNLTEEYALPLQFACLWLIYDFEKSRFPQRRLFLIGILCGIAFFTKQTTIGIGCAIVLYLAVRRLSSGRANQLLRELLMMLAGGLAVCGVVVVFFAARGALQQFWSAAFAFNFAYVSSGGDISSRLSSLLPGLEPLTWVWLLPFSLVGYFIGLLMLFYRKEPAGNQSTLLSIGLLDLPIEFFLVAVSGRPYAHYFINMLPVLALLSASSFWALFSRVPHWATSNLAKGVFAVGFMGVFLGSSSNIIVGLIQLYGQRPPIERVLTYLRASTSPNDTVLVWGAEASLNYVSHRRSPTRFVYQYPLYQPNYASEQMTEEFLGDLIQNRPRVIIESYNPATPMYEFPIQTAAIESEIAYLKSHYRVRENFGDWTIYEYIQNESGP